MTRPKIGIPYRDSQGNTYLILGFCRIYETNQEQVVFQNTKYGEDPNVWVTPVSKFFKTPDGDKRFTEVKQRKE